MADGGSGGALVDPEFTALCDAELASAGPAAALGFMFKEMCRTGYIAEERLSLNANFAPQSVVWRTASLEGEEASCTLEVSINCSKPELAVGVVRKSTPLAPGASCVICPENVGHKPGLRGWSLIVGGRPFFLQCPPYPYCELHTVLVETEHTPQKISEQTLHDLTDAATQLRGMYICSNTDLSGTGASILQHKHYQLIGKRLPVCDAPTAFAVSRSSTSGDARAAMLDFPTAAVRVTAETAVAVIEATNALLDSWRSVEMAKAVGTSLDTHTLSFICSVQAQDSPASSESPGGFEMIIIPRTQAHVTSESMHCIKSEFVGILEAAGFGILPGRLKTELTQVLLENQPLEGELTKYSRRPASPPSHIVFYRVVAQSVDCRYEHWLQQLNISRKPDHAADLASSPIAAQALYSSFVTILKDNSGFDACDHAIAKKWLAQAGFR